MGLGYRPMQSLYYSFNSRDQRPSHDIDGDQTCGLYSSSGSMEKWIASGILLALSRMDHLTLVSIFVLSGG
ncbi:hypothetical protein K1719_021311 [Acacia pycnantha]|nr:hypothetical protein K1719_026801 [Acacia pycnantha]KAI9107648.1 hypothetical protein K1719_021311 [Acacia pycnantha]